MITFLSKKLVVIRSLYLSAILVLPLWIVLLTYRFPVYEYGMVTLASINSALASAVFILVKDAKDIRMHAAEKILFGIFVSFIFFVSLILTAIYYFAPALD